MKQKNIFLNVCVLELSAEFRKNGFDLAMVNKPSVSELLKCDSTSQIIASNSSY